ncbi:MAG: hypothetical protein FWE61_04915, partial [Micrococcales bacterium]|nr:hypothetical protein [Micrococcales bacterium]
MNNQSALRKAERTFTLVALAGCCSLFVLFLLSLHNRYLFTDHVWPGPVIIVLIWLTVGSIWAWSWAHWRAESLQASSGSFNYGTEGLDAPGSKTKVIQVLTRRQAKRVIFLTIISAALGLLAMILLGVVAAAVFVALVSKFDMNATARVVFQSNGSDGVTTLIIIAIAMFLAAVGWPAISAVAERVISTPVEAALER